MVAQNANSPSEFPVMNSLHVSYTNQNLRTIALGLHHHVALGADFEKHSSVYDTFV